MKKADLVTAIKGQVDCSTEVASTMIDATFDAMKAELKAGRLFLDGFGSFTTKALPARMGRNPKSGEPVKIAARTKISFKPAKELKELVNSKKKK